MGYGELPVPRVRQAVLAARDLDSVVARLRSELSLGQPFADPAVSYFGLRNAVFALGETFLEVVSPAAGASAAERLISRRGGDCGYMVMFQVEDLDGARERARRCGVREVFEVEFDDIAEVHLHPNDMRGAIVSLSRPRPRGSWRWGGPDWDRRSAPLGVAAVRLGVREPAVVAERWREVIGGLPGVEFVADQGEPGLVEIAITGLPARPSLDLGGVRLVFADRCASPSR